MKKAKVEKVTSKKVISKCMLVNRQGGASDPVISVKVEKQNKVKNMKSYKEKNLESNCVQT